MIVVVSFVVVVLGALGALQLGFDRDARIYFAPDSDERHALDALEARHGRLGTVAFVVAPDSGTVYAPDPIEAIAGIVSGLRAIAEVAGYRALSELPIGEGGSSASERVAAGDVLSGPDLDNLRAMVVGDRRVSGPLVSEDGSVAAVIATLRQDGSGVRSEAAVMDDLVGIRDAARKDHPDIAIMMTGSAALDATFIEALRSDLLRLVPAQIVLLVILLLVTLGSISATLALLAVLGVATTVTMGVAGWLGMTLNGVISAVPTVLLGLAVATCVHIILAWQEGLRHKPDRAGALVHALAVNAKPVTLAIVTTIASFLCLNFSASPPFREFGNLVAFGLTVTFVLSFTLLPALLLLIPPSQALSRRAAEAGMARLGAGVLKSRAVILLLFAAMCVAAAVGIERIRFDDTFTHYFDTRFEFRQATDLYEAKLTGITVVEASIPAADGGTIATRDNLAKLRDFAAWAENQPHVVAATSIVNFVAAAGRNYPGILDDRGMPVSDAVAAQIVGAYGQADDPGLPPSLVDKDARYAHVSIVLRQVSSSALLGFADAADAKLAEIWSPAIARVTGAPILAAHLSSRNTRTMLYGTLVALVVISAILALALGGMRMGLVSLVPNLVPLILAYGFWGLIFQDVSFAATVVVAMTFGIVVDDTVHIMARYQYLRRTRPDLDPVTAVVESFRSVGVAVLITSVAIASGFAVLAFSGFLVNRHLGLLTVITLVAALVTDLVFLPLLLVWSDRKKPVTPA